LGIFMNIIEVGDLYFQTRNIGKHIKASKKEYMWRFTVRYLENG